MSRRVLLPLFMLALLLGTWTGRSYLTELALTYTLQRYGMQDVAIEIHDIGLHQSNIATLGFTSTTQNGQFRINARETRLTYTPGLLTSKRIDSLTIDTLTVAYEMLADDSSNKATIEQKLEPVKLIAALRHALREYITFNTITIENIIAEGDSFGALNHNKLQLNSINNNGIIDTRLLLQQSPLNHADRLQRTVTTQVSDKRLSISLGYSGINKPAATTLELAIGNTSIDGNYRVDFEQLVNWLKPLIDISTMSPATEINGSLSAEFKADDHIITTITAACDKLNYKSYDANNAGLKLRIQIPTVNPLQDARFLNGSYIKAGSLTYQDLTFHDLRLNLVGNLSLLAGSWQYTGGVSTKTLEIRHLSQVLQLSDIAARLSASAQNLAASGDFSTASLAGKFIFTLDHDFNQSAGQLDLRQIKTFNLNTDNSKLSQLLTPWPYPFDLYSGKLDLAAQAAWSQDNEFMLTTRIKLDAGGGAIAAALFSGLSFDHQLQVAPRLRTVDDGSITLEYLDSGVIASNIQAALQFTEANTGTLPQLVIQGLHGELLGGTFSADDFVYDLNRERNRFVITAADIDLAAIIEAQQLENIEVTGKVDGTVPIVISNQGVLVEHGAFINNISEGTIRYNPAAGSEQLKQNPLTKIALDALKDFHYNHLSADVNFRPEGTLTVNIQLKGESPELDTDRPVHLNINTEQNLLSLLKSLRFAEGISANIDRKVRRQYEKNQQQ